MIIKMKITFVSYNLKAWLITHKQLQIAPKLPKLKQ
jgi:hypothetical protein